MIKTEINEIEKRKMINKKKKKTDEQNNDEIGDKPEAQSTLTKFAKKMALL